MTIIAQQAAALDTLSRLLVETQLELSAAIATLAERRAKDTARKAQARERGGTVGVALRFQALTRDHFRCRYCGVNGKAFELHVDHVVPLARGGESTLDNLATACAPCNLGKSDTLLPCEVTT